LYSAPEVLGQEVYSYKVDIWALGILACELLTGKVPFLAKSYQELIDRINHGDYLIRLNEPFTVECALFLTHCLQAVEEQRISISVITAHPFFTSIKLHHLVVEDYKREL
jgi:serine/threonine protein kinase